ANLFLPTGLAWFLFFGDSWSAIILPLFSFTLCPKVYNPVRSIGFSVTAAAEDRQCFKDDRLAILITTDDAGHGFVDENNRGGAVATEMAELDGLEAHGDFLIYS